MQSNNTTNDDKRIKLWLYISKQNYALMFMLICTCFSITFLCFMKKLSIPLNGGIFICIPLKREICIKSILPAAYKLTIENLLIMIYKNYDRKCVFL